jgi:hypothetical protein
MTQSRQDATQYVTAMGALISQALPAVQAAPALGEYLGEVIKATGRPSATTARTQADAQQVA